MSDAILEQRLVVIEESIRDLQKEMRKRASPPDWLDHVIGSMKGEAAFDEVLALGKAARQADAPVEEPGL